MPGKGEEAGCPLAGDTSLGVIEPGSMWRAGSPGMGYKDCVQPCSYTHCVSVCNLNSFHKRGSLLFLSCQKNLMTSIKDVN